MSAPATSVARVLAREELLEAILRHCRPLDLASNAVLVSRCALTCTLAEAENEACAVLFGAQYAVCSVLVCRQWRALIAHSESVWARHLDPALLDLHRGLRQAPRGTSNNAAATAPAHKPAVPDLSLLSLFVACHTRNLLRNPSMSRSVNIAASPLARSRRPWVVRESGSSVVFENPPQGVRPESELCHFPPPPLRYARGDPGRLLSQLADRPLDSALRALQRLVAPEQPGCLATTKDWAEIVQVVDLQGELVSRGLTPPQAQAVLNAGLPLGFSIMVAAHHSHSATFAVGLMLDDGKGPVPSMQSFVKRQASYHFFSHKRYIRAGSGWQRFAHVVPSCPPGCRRAVVLLRGRMSGGSGNAQLGGVFLDANSAERSDVPLGAKFASAELVLLAAQRVAAYGENSMSSRWRRPQEAVQSNEDLTLPATEHPPLHQEQAEAAALALPVLVH